MGGGPGRPQAVGEAAPPGLSQSWASGDQLGHSCRPDLGLNLGSALTSCPGLTLPHSRAPPSRPQVSSPDRVSDTPVRKEQKERGRAGSRRDSGETDGELPDCGNCNSWAGRGSGVRDSPERHVEQDEQSSAWAGSRGMDRVTFGSHSQEAYKS